MGVFNDIYTIARVCWAGDDTDRLKDVAEEALRRIEYENKQDEAFNKLFGLNK